MERAHGPGSELDLVHGAGLDVHQKDAVIGKQGGVFTQLPACGAVAWIGSEFTRLDLCDEELAGAFQHEVDADSVIHGISVDPDRSRIADLSALDPESQGLEQGFGVRLALEGARIPAPARTSGSGASLSQQPQQDEDQRNQADDDGELGIHDTSLPAVVG